MSHNFNALEVKKQLDNAFHNNSEQELLDIIKDNLFLLSSLYSRQWGIQPNFCEVGFGNKFRCDFCWLNDNSDGPEWVIVEIEKPKLKLFTKKVTPTADLNNAIEQVKTWQRYFDKQPHEKSRIFGAVSKFRWILVAGRRDDWIDKGAIDWRSYENKESRIEIRSVDIFYDTIEDYLNNRDSFWSFAENPKSLSSNKLEDFCTNSDYISFWKSRIL